MTEPRPIILTCGEPAGVGPELAAKALAAGVPFVYLGDPRHLPAGTRWAEVATPLETVGPGILPVLRHDFAGVAVPRSSWRFRGRRRASAPCRSARRR
jgi:4-hydroxythreonine-4-phosphate dehydrogenase